jgi:hypothetical protein
MLRGLLNLPAELVLPAKCIGPSLGVPGYRRELRCLRMTMCFSPFSCFQALR